MRRFVVRTITSILNFISINIILIIAYILAGDIIIESFALRNFVNPECMGRAATRKPSSKERDLLFTFFPKYKMER